MELASDQVLREIEAMAEILDTLDPSPGGPSHTPAEPITAAQIYAKRQRTLLELEVANVLSPELGEGRTKLVALGLPHLVAYHDAAVDLRHYLTRPTRARLVRTPPPERLLESRVSLDWFRRPSRYSPPGVADLDWLALCEANLNGTTRPGCSFVKLEGAYHQLWTRVEIDALPRLYFAVPG